MRSFLLLFGTVFVVSSCSLSALADEPTADPSAHASTAAGAVEGERHPPVDSKPAAPTKEDPKEVQEAEKKPRSKAGGAGPADPPAYYKKEENVIDGPSVVDGQSAGIEVGTFPPDFELEPILPYPHLLEWLGEEDPASLEKHVTLSDLVGEAPILLLFGSYT